MKRVLWIVLLVAGLACAGPDRKINIIRCRNFISGFSCFCIFAKTGLATDGYRKVSICEWRSATHSTGHVAAIPAAT